MRAVALLAIGEVERPLLENLRLGISRQLSLPCTLLAEQLDPGFALHPERGQYHSTEILGRMSRLLLASAWRLLGVTGFDLYIPVLTFVFGEAQLGDACAVVSYHRLRQEFYGLPADQELLRARLLKEAIHELGHTLDLTHCEDITCVMSASHAVEWIDLKLPGFCPACRTRALATGNS